MSDFITALGLVLVIEGVLWAAFPDAMRRYAAQVLSLPPTTLRRAGLAAALLGLVVVALIRA